MRIIAATNRNLDSVEKNIILDLMRSKDGNLTQIARELGIARTTLYRKLKKYDIHREDVI